MFEKKTCERCGKQYRMRTLSENRGHYLCLDCIKHCSECGVKLPRSHWFGETTSLSTAFTSSFGIGVSPNLAHKEYLEKAWIGSGLCMSCYQAKVKKEQEEQQLVRQAQLRKAKDIIETPTVWNCPYCNAVNRGNFCSNCGSPRKR